MRLSHPALAIGAVLLLTAAVYAPVLSFQFVNFDDDVYLTANPEVGEGLTWRSTGWAFTTLHAGFWHPLTWLSHLAAVSLFGTGPGGHHLVNLLLHLANTLLLFLALRALTGAAWRSALVAALFALHPLHVEAVAWVSQRKELLAAAFFFLGLWAYARSSSHPRRGWSLAVAACFLLGFASKAMVITFPFLLLLLDRWPLGRWQPGEGWRSIVPPGRLVREKLLLLLLVVPFSLLAYRAESGFGALRPEGYGFPEVLHRLGNAVLSYGRTLGKTVWPAHLSASYPLEKVLPAGETAAAGVLLIGVSALAWRERKRRPHLLVGWFWFLGMMVPVIGIVPLGNFSMADRFTYLPLVGIFLACSWALGEAVERRPRVKVPALVLTGALLLALAFSARAQVGVWRDSETLARHGLAVDGRSPLMANNLGEVLLGRGDLAGAERWFRRADELDPASVAAVNLARLEMRRGRWAEAEALLRDLLSRRPQDAEAHISLGRILAQRGEDGEAAEEYRAALVRSGGDPDVRASLGAALGRLGRHAEALEVLEAGVRAYPRHPDLLHNLGVTLVLLGREEAARRILARSLQVREEDPLAHLWLGRLLAAEGLCREAVPHFRRALALDPTLEEAQQALEGCGEVTR